MQPLGYYALLFLLIGAILYVSITTPLSGIGSNVNTANVTPGNLIIVLIAALGGLAFVFLRKRT